MILAGMHAEATGVFYTMISGDRQDLKGKLARVQDNAEELLALIKENVTEEQAMRYGFIANIVKALEMRGYGRRIRFKETPLPALPREKCEETGSRIASILRDPGEKRPRGLRSKGLTKNRFQGGKPPFFYGPESDRDISGET